MRISDWSSDVCSSDLRAGRAVGARGDGHVVDHHAVLGADVGGTDVGLGIQPVGQDSPVDDAGDQLLHLRMVDAEHGESVDRDVLDEGVEGVANARSEEHTSELQSLMRISYAVFCLKKKTTTKTKRNIDTHL